MDRVILVLKEQLASICRLYFGIFLWEIVNKIKIISFNVATSLNYVRIFFGCDSQDVIALKWCKKPNANIR